MASESLPLLLPLQKHPFLHPSVTSSAKAQLAFASTSANKASVQNAKRYRPSTVISPIHELSEVTLEISIHPSEFIPEAKKNQQLTIRGLQFSNRINTAMVFMKVHRLQKRNKKSSSPWSAGPISQKIHPVLLLCLTTAKPLSSLFYKQHLLGIQDSVSKASSQGEQAHRDGCEEETFLKGEQIFTEATAFPYLSGERRSRPSVAFRRSARRWFCRTASELGLHLRDQQAILTDLLASIHSATGKQRNRNQDRQKKESTEVSHAVKVTTP